MAYTTQQLQGMSDFEVNKALAEKLGHKVSVLHEGTESQIVVVNSIPAVINFTGNHSHIMPLAFERKIGLAPNKDSWEAFTLADNFQVISRQYVDKSPLRAIACLLLMMED